MTRRALPLLFASACAAVALAPGEPSSPKPAPPRPKLYTLDLGGRELRFLTDAREIGAQQAFLCELAENRAQSDQVKSLASVLKQTQTEENHKLARLAEREGVMLDVLTAAGEKGLVKKFVKLEGAKFDKLWLQEIAALNKRAVANCETVQESSDADVKAYAAASLPLAREKLLVVNKLTGSGQPAPRFRTSPSAPPSQ